MGAGALSDDKVVEASKKLVNILADCTAKGTHGELKKKYNLKYYPTALFIDGEGKVLATLNARDAKGIASQMNGIAAKHTKEGTKGGDKKEDNGDKKEGDKGEDKK